MPPRVTLAMLAEHDAATLSRCLASAADLVDEVVVVTQPGGSPAWKAEAESFGAKLVELPWPDDFSTARDESLRHASGDWAFYLDADEWLDDENRGRLGQLLASLPEPGVAGYAFAQVSPSELGRPVAVRQVRLYRNAPGVGWRYRVHEQVAHSLRPHGAVRDADVEVRHDGYADPARAAAKRRRNARLAALDLADLPRDPFVLYNAGCSALDEGRPADSVRLLEASRTFGRGDPLAAPATALVTAPARARFAAGDAAGALRVCIEALADSPDDPDLLFVAAAAGRKSDPATSEGRLRRCVAVDPRHGMAWQLLADLLLASDRGDAADAVGRRLARVPGMAAEAVAVRARVLLARRDRVASRRALERGLEQAPASPLLLELLANVLILSGDRPAARAALGRLLAACPGHPWASRTLSGLARTTSPRKSETTAATAAAPA